MNEVLKKKLAEYAEKYYNRISVEDGELDTGVIRIFVPEADQMFLLGLGQFNVRITKIVPAQNSRIRISVMEMKT